MSIEEREEAGEFSGIDWGEEELIDSVYFSPDFDSYSADTGLVIA